MTTQKVTMGAFRTLASSHRAIEELERAGIPYQTISLVMPDSAREDFARLDQNTKAAEGAAVGGMSGMAIGGLAAGLTAVATVLVPGIGFVAAGPIVAALAGAGAGAAAGGAIGGLIGLGLTEHEAKFHTDVLKEGGFVVAVTSSVAEEQKRAREILGRLGVRSEQVKGSVAYTSERL